MADFDPLDRIQRNLRNMPDQPPRSPMGSTAETLRQMGGAPPPQTPPQPQRTPSWGDAATSPERAAWERERAAQDAARRPPMAAPAPAAPSATQPASRLARASEGAGKLAGRTSRIGLQALATAPLVGFGDYKLNDPGTDSSLGGTLRALGGGDFAGAGRSLQKGAVEAGLDAASGVAKTVDAVTGLTPWGTDLRGALDRRVRADLGDQLLPADGASAQPAPTGQGVAPTTTQPATPEPSSGAGLGAPPAPSGLPQAPGQPTARTTNDVVRSGNEYSGTNVSGDITINGMPSGFGLGRGGVISPQNMGAADALSERDRLRSLGAVAAQQAAPAQPQGFQAPVVRSSLNDWEIRNNLRNARISAGSSMSDLWNKRFGSREQRARMSPEMAEYMTLLAADREALGAQPKMDLETGKSNNTLRGDIFKAQSSADATRYTSDNSLRGDIFRAQSSAATARQSALTTAQKDALERSDKQYEAGQKRLDEIFTTAATRGGEVNPQMLNRYRTGVTAYLGNAVAEARKRGDEETARAIEREGPSALARDPVLLRKYMAQMELDDIGRGDSGYLRTDNPGGLAITGQTPGILGLGRKYEVTDARGNKSYISRNAVDYENGGPFTNWNPWATRTDRADLLKQRN